jgi:hypothetical protein
VPNVSNDVYLKSRYYGKFDLGFMICFLKENNTDNADSFWLKLSGPILQRKKKKRLLPLTTIKNPGEKCIKQLSEDSR